MAKPEISKVYVDKFLTNYSISYKNGSFISDIIAPSVDVKGETGIFYRFGMEGFYIEDDNRALGAAANEVQWEPSEDTYKCREKALSKGTAQRILDQEDSPIKSAVRNVEILKNKVYLAKEYRVADLLITSGGFASVTLNAASKWDNPGGATSDPFTHITTGKTAVRKGCLENPNYIIIPPSIAEVLQQHPDYIDRIKNTDSRTLTETGLPTKILGLTVLSPDCYTVDNEKAEVTDATELWGNNVIIMYVNGNPGLDTVNTITTFVKREGRVRRWFDERAESQYVEFSMILGEEVVCTGGAYVIKSVLGTWS